MPDRENAVKFYRTSAVEYLLDALGKNVTLSEDSIRWAIEHVARHGDGDLFPKPLELEAAQDEADMFVGLVEGKALGQFKPGAHRRFIVPKDEVSYRQATQLHPQDSILLTAVIHQFGAGIESRREGPDRIFSYRFAPTPDRGLYAATSSWNDFWTRAHELSKSHSDILCCDIADFYNQVYHHEVENQMIQSGFSNQAAKWVLALIASTTAGVSRGVPVGPHPIHLVAEATLIPIDESLVSAGLDFIRYVDDIIVFCDSPKEAHAALATLATVLDRPQRLMLQRHKTTFYDSEEFQVLCAGMIEDRPINSDEADLLALVKKYSGGNPYKTVFLSEIEEADWESISEATLRRIVEQYLSETTPDFIRLRWLYRRLAQIGHPGAISVSLEYLEELAPCFAGICFYLASVQSIDPSDWISIGRELLSFLDTEEVKSSEYFALLVLSLFSKNEHINHFNSLAKKYESSSPFVRREILLAAKINSAFGWMRQYKESFLSMDDWQKLAFIYGCSGLPDDEKKYFINLWATSMPFEEVLAKWSKSEPRASPGCSWPTH